jgi:hypothetical protein
MDFGAVSSGTDKAFPAYTGSEYLPYYPSIIRVAVPSTGDFAEISIPPGTTQPKIGFSTTAAITTTPDNPGTVNIYKVGTTLHFQFNMNVPDFLALRIL